jgi:hypothetical protein
VYRIRSEMGPDHSKQFHVEVMVGRRVLGTGNGPNKKEAEQAAARAALEGVSPSRPTEIRVEPRRGASEASAPVAGLVDAKLETDLDADEIRSRRRGRRGGRGRRRREPPSSISAPTMSEPSRPTKSVSGESVEPAMPRRERVPNRAMSSPAERTPNRVVASQIERSRPLREMEPPPSAFEEDEYEEVGRPEEPREERHVDPFAMDVIEPEPRARAGTSVASQEPWAVSTHGAAGDRPSGPKELGRPIERQIEEPATQATQRGSSEESSPVTRPTRSQEDLGPLMSTEIEEHGAQNDWEHRPSASGTQDEQREQPGSRPAERVYGRRGRRTPRGS